MLKFEIKITDIKPKAVFEKEMAEARAQYEELIKKNKAQEPELIAKYVKENNISAENILSTKSCFYYRKEDFKAFQVNQCIHNRSTYDKPNKEFLCSNNFSFEDWQNLVKIDQNTK